jgi:hypothetical protein
MRTAMLLLLLVLGSAGDSSAGPTGSAVDVQIRSDSGRILRPQTGECTSRR